MKEIDRIRLFKSETSKADLLANKQDRLIAVLDSYVLDGKCNFKIDSNHVSTITLDGDLLGDLVNEIDERAIIEIHVLNQDHYFVVFNPKKDLDEIELSCKYWGTATLESMYIVDSKPRNLDGLAMMDWLKTNTEEYKQGNQYARDLEVASNLSDLKSTNIWHNNFYDTVSDLQDLYGCEIKKEGFKVELVDYVGSKTAKYKVEYGKNLISNSSEEDLSIIKGVLAKGYDKIYADNIIYSGKLADNPNLLGQTVEKVYPVRVREEGKEDEDGYTYYNTESEAKAELERLARLEFTVNKVDEPKVTFDTEFLELSTVEEHKDDAKVWLSIGDKIATYIPKFNIDIETRIIEMEVDVLADEITNITLSNNNIKDLKPPTLNSIKKEIQKLPSVEEVLTVAKNESLNTVMSGFGGHARHYPDRSIYMDTDNEKTCRYCMIINYKGYFFSKGGVNPRPEDVTMIADINGNFYADVINAGTLNANLIKAGILKSFNGNSWLNMENGNFDFAKGNLSFDGKNLQMIGKLINILNGFGIEMNQGGLMFANEGEIVGGIRSSRFLSNTAINGFNLVSTRDGDYIDISFTDGENFEGSPDFVPIIRITKSKHELMGNFKGIQLLDDVRVSSDKDLFVENVYRGTTAEGTKFGRYYNNTWCGSIEATAKRISNLNVFYDSGWYAYSNGANGAPSSYGIMLHFKWNTEDFIQIAFDFANTMYQRAWVNGAWTSWKTR